MISVVFGGPSSPEHDISILTGLQCERVLSSAGREVQSIYWTRAGGFFLLKQGLEASDFENGVPNQSVELVLELGKASGFYRSSVVRRRKVETGTVINCCHGGPGESGVLSSLLDMCGIQCTGGSPWSSMLGMDKLAFSSVASTLGIPVLARVPVSVDMGQPAFEPPYIIKPRLGGSSLGIKVVADLESALALAGNYGPLRNGAVLEPYLAQAVDLNLAYSTHPALRFSLLEKPLRDAGDEFYDFEAKYLRGGGLQAAPRELPAQVSEVVLSAAHEFATRLISAVGFGGLGRIDYLLVEGELFLNEVNTIPGAMGFYLWQDSVEFSDLLDALTAGSSDQANWSGARYGEDPGAALRVASGISQKLLQNRGGGND